MSGSSRASSSVKSRSHRLAGGVIQEPAAVRRQQQGRARTPRTRAPAIVRSSLRTGASGAAGGRSRETDGEEQEGRREPGAGRQPPARAAGARCRGRACFVGLRPGRERDAGLADVAQPQLRVALEAALEQAADAARCRGRERGPLRLPREDRGEHVAHRLAVEEPAGRSAARRRARRRTRRPSACRRASRAPARATCRRRCPGSGRPRCCRARASATARDPRTTPSRSPDRPSTPWRARSRAP